jgi:hypothetical protein
MPALGIPQQLPPQTESNSNPTLSSTQGASIAGGDHQEDITFHHAAEHQQEEAEDSTLADLENQW